MRRIAWLLLWLVGGAVNAQDLPVEAAPAAAVRLVADGRPLPAAGASLVIESAIVVTVGLSVPDAQGEEIKGVFEQESIEEWTCDVIDADSVEIQFVQKRTTETLSVESKAVSETIHRDPLESQRVRGRLVRDEAGHPFEWVFSLAGEKTPTAAELIALRELQSPFLDDAIFPEEPVSIGDEWLSEADLMGDGEAETNSLKLAYEKDVEKDGVPTAQLSVVAITEGLPLTLASEETLEIKLTGYVTRSLANLSDTSWDLQGPIQISSPAIARVGASLDPEGSIRVIRRRIEKTP